MGPPRVRSWRRRLAESTARAVRRAERSGPQRETRVFRKSESGYSNEHPACYASRGGGETRADLPHLRAGARRAEPTKKKYRWEKKTCGRKTARVAQHLDRDVRRAARVSLLTAAAVRRRGPPRRSGQAAHAARASMILVFSAPSSAAAAAAARAAARLAPAAAAAVNAAAAGSSASSMVRSPSLAPP